MTETHNNPFGNYRDSCEISIVLEHPKINVGKRSYYAGYYHGHSFEECVLYLDGADKKKDVDSLIIGKYCSIASGVKFMMSGNQGHRHDWIATYPLDIFDARTNPTKKFPVAFQKKGDTVIGNDVWLGYEALIMPGITIGDGAVIGARALVTKDVAPYTIVGGNHAKVIKQRFSDEDIATLLEVKWWDWPEEKIKDHLEGLRSGDVENMSKAI